jgi:hypothetical protein
VARERVGAIDRGGDLRRRRDGEPSLPGERARFRVFSIAIGTNRRVVGAHGGAGRVAQRLRPLRCHGGAQGRLAGARARVAPGLLKKVDAGQTVRTRWRSDARRLAGALVVAAVEENLMIT